MTLFPSLQTLFPMAAAMDGLTVPELRWQLVGFAIGAVILSFGLAGLSLFLLQRRTVDRSLVYFSLFSFLYAVRLIFRLGFLRAVVPASAEFWKYSDLVINNFVDNFIVVPLTLFLIQVVGARWKMFLQYLLAFQIVFAATRFCSKLFHKAEHPIDIIYHVVIIAYCALLTAYPFSFSSERRMPREAKVVYAGLAVFGIFIVRNNLADLGLAPRGQKH